MYEYIFTDQTKPALIKQKRHLILTWEYVLLYNQFAESHSAESKNFPFDHAQRQNRSKATAFQLSERRRRRWF